MIASRAAPHKRPFGAQSVRPSHGLEIRRRIAYIAAVEAALAGHDGALLAVSHDRDFLSAIGIEREIVL
jgi:hypothetical protein